MIGFFTNCVAVGISNINEANNGKLAVNYPHSRGALDKVVLAKHSHIFHAGERAK